MNTGKPRATQTTAPGPTGQIAHPTLVEHRRKVEPGPVPAGDNLFCLMGIGICNTQLVMAPEGIIVVDTGLSESDGTAILAWKEKLSPLPIIAIVYSHSHYTFGTAAIREQYPEIPVIGHRKVHRNTAEAMTGLRKFMVHRAIMESARELPHEGPDADPIGSRIHTPGRMGYVRPTIELEAETESLTIGGLDLVFHTRYPFDTNDSLIIWIPEYKAIIHNHFASNFPNIYPIQGGRYRDPEPWIAGIDRMRAYRPEHLLSTHGFPEAGVARCYERLTAVRDALQFVHDQTIRGMNMHLTPEQLVDFVRLPQELMEHPDLQQTYGLVINHVRGIFSGRAGWFDGDPATIEPPEPELEARKVVDGFGGVENTIGMMRDALDGEDYRWAARLGTWLLRLQPENRDIRSCQARALRALGQRTTAWTVRNYYITAARILEGQTSIPDSAARVDVETALQLPPGTFVRSLSYRCNPGAFPSQATTLTVRFRDTPFECFLVLRRGVAEYVEGHHGEPDCSIACARTRWIEAVEGSDSIALLADDPDVEALPDRDTLRTILRVFDRG